MSILCTHHISPVLADEPPAFVEIFLPNISKADVSRLSSMGMVIVTRRGTTALASVTQEQLDQMQAMGLEWEILPESSITETRKIPAGYLSFATVQAQLQQIAAQHSDICHLESIGESTNGLDLWFMKISDNVNQEEDEPEFKYISTMHGNEVVGTDLMMKLINLLVTAYKDTGHEYHSRVANLVDNAEIWIMPIMNPDGYVSMDRENALDIDLNRNFPDRITDPVNTLKDYTGNDRATEVRRIMAWAFNHSSVLSANLHTGALVANYPYDGNDLEYPYNAVNTPTPDDDLFVALSLTYASRNHPMYINPEFPPYGIINGADWYVIDGGMQDWNYVWMGCMEITLELYQGNGTPSYYYPYYSGMAQLWEDNRDALLAYMEWCLRGVRGIVTDAKTGAVLSATVTASGSDFKVYTDPDVGDYHRILLPGSYDITVTAPGYWGVTIPVEVTDGDASRLDVALYTDIGDFDCNGSLGVGDAIAALQIVSGLSSGAVCPDATPIVGDSAGLDDALWILQCCAELREKVVPAAK